MRVLTNVRIEAADPIHVRHRGDLDVSYIGNDAETYSSGIAVDGTLQERIEFFERLAAIAADTARELRATASEAVDA